MTWLHGIGASPYAVFWTMGILAVAVFDGLGRHFLPANVLTLLPALAFCGGVFLGRRLPAIASNREPRTEIVPSQMERAATERVEHPIAAPAPELREHNRASPGRVGEVIAFPAPAHADASLERAIAELSQYHAFTAILGKQLNSVTELSEEAATGVLTSLTAIDRQIGELVTYIRSAGATEQATTVISRIESQMTGCSDLLDQFAIRQKTEAQDGREQRSRMMIETARVLEVIEGVNTVARQTTMLSLNVSIEAARAGEAGRGFAVIGHEIRRLASEAQNLSVDVHTRVESLIGMITLDMKSKAEEKEKIESASLAEISSKMAGLTRNIVSFINDQNGLLLEVESKNASISAPLMDAMGRIQFQDIIRQQIEQLINMSNTVDEHFILLIETLGDRKDIRNVSSLKAKLDHLFDGYVMERQRETHLSVRGQANTRQVTPMIELF